MSQVYQTLGDGGLRVTEEGVGRFLDSYRGRNGGNAGLALGLFLCEALAQKRVVGVDFLRKAQIGQGVFVCAINLGCIRQRSQAA